MQTQHVLVVGDAHVDEHQSLDRFKALGKKIETEQPDHVVFIGDFLSMNCLSDWDKNKRCKMENRRYHLEIAAGNKALDYAMSECRADVHYIEGNHEDRQSRYFDVDPTFLGTSSIKGDLHLADRGIEWVPYKSCLNIDGVSFTHIPITSLGKAIGNPNVAQKALKLFHNSVVFGHTHTLDHAAEHRHGSPHLNQALSVGCFFEHVDEYAQGSLTNYWRGLVDLYIYDTNRFDFSTTSMRQLYTQYSSPAGRGKSSTPVIRISRATRRPQRPSK
ncbi:Calcineurin-like phosphoesterase domain, lpxH type [uncultured Caudovirales phage]|uniref:Calcineurin-like phosphoesterase domain, lpxH type n=1 Tax=uncultured Caudovirales phage TaxID=2100421 RepID=A0A6J7X8T9_9CAUD|nr:Calcineurin-like phosphoesterase domain, lpxH type [uncultured Caudovirales phage]CAB4182463.1 Calcineurin-like phosphoesterase domain, lpxH type [uncultured Caudovirales phage]CAB4197832.1 Calcineurin-like phosphoesterase domain, lpxH type [uncultured Caudovirales phage]CAB4212503.1 Calcineurin-like phosphoesterase domain, lpxH type [uncultured Caudovirales phage]CAB5227153.1 Calcineurin-like phosphoesterase domain, lpxH type [uncultured Caudovirales phage]